jgi:hypothetical protein
MTEPAFGLNLATLPSIPSAGLKNSTKTKYTSFIFTLAPKDPSNQFFVVIRAKPSDWTNPLLTPIISSLGTAEVNRLSLSLTSAIKSRQISEIKK